MTIHASNNVEIERKFLVDFNEFQNDLQTHGYSSSIIKQGYWSPQKMASIFHMELQHLGDAITHTDYETLKTLGPEGLELRIRQSDDNFFLTFKGKKGLSTGGIHEFEYKINEKTALLLLDNCDFLIAKTRYFVPLSDHLTVEVDVFEVPSGLVLAEIEIPDIDHPLPKLPHWMTKEVTGQPAYFNRVLAEQGFKASI